MQSKKIVSILLKIKKIFKKKSKKIIEPQFNSEKREILYCLKNKPAPEINDGYSYIRAEVIKKAANENLIYSAISKILNYEQSTHLCNFLNDKNNENKEKYSNVMISRLINWLQIPITTLLNIQDSSKINIKYLNENFELKKEIQKLKMEIMQIESRNIIKLNKIKTYLIEKNPEIYRDIENIEKLLN